MIAPLLVLVIVAQVYGKPQENPETNSNLHTPDDRCPPSKTHYLLPHEYDCAKFYYCEYGQRYIKPRDCAPGTHFSYEIQVCIHPEQAGCTLPGQPTTSAPSSTVSTASTTPPSTTSTTTNAPTSPTPPGGGTESDRCKDDCHVPHWAHETDCDKFWRCVGNQKVLGVCSEGLHFNEQTLTCDFMCNVGCERNVVQTTAQRDGLKVFMPWDKVDKFLKLSKRNEVPQIDFGIFQDIEIKK